MAMTNLISNLSRNRNKPNSQNLICWKVYEVSATPIFSKEAKMAEEGAGPLYVLCTETVKKRRLSKNPTNFEEEGIIDMKDATVLWLPGTVTGRGTYRKTESSLLA